MLSSCCVQVRALRARAQRVVGEAVVGARACFDCAAATDWCGRLAAMHERRFADNMALR